MKQVLVSRGCYGPNTKETPNVKAYHHRTPQYHVRHLTSQTIDWFSRGRDSRASKNRPTPNGEKGHKVYEVEIRLGIIIGILGDANDQLIMVNL